MLTTKQREKLIEATGLAIAARDALLRAESLVCGALQTTDVLATHVRATASNASALRRLLASAVEGTTDVHGTIPPDEEG